MKTTKAVNVGDVVTMRSIAYNVGSQSQGERRTVPCPPMTSKQLVWGGVVEFRSLMGGV